MNTFISSCESRHSNEYREDILNSSGKKPRKGAWERDSKNSVGYFMKCLTRDLKPETPAPWSVAITRVYWPCIWRLVPRSKNTKVCGKLITVGGPSLSVLIHIYKGYLLQMKILKFEPFLLCLLADTCAQHACYVVKTIFAGLGYCPVGSLIGYQSTVHLHGA